MSTHCSTSPTTGILSLPPDIFYHIMWTLSEGWITLNPNADIWALTRVCRQWRAIALDYHSLWSHILIDKDDLWQTLHPVVILEECLKRSSGSLLHLRVYIERLLVHANILDTLIPYSHRWCTLDLETSLFLLKCVNIQFNGRALPSLKQLRLSLIDIPTDIPNLTLFQNCPELEDVTLNTAISRYLAVNLPWSQLRKLTIIEREHGDLLNVLKNTSNLTSCTLMSLVSRPRPKPDLAEVPFSPIVRPSVRSLTLHSTEELDSEILNHLIFPNLDTLVAGNMFTSSLLDGNTFSSFSVLSSFLTRSSCNLTTLKLRGVLFNDDSLVRMFEATPTVETLSLEDWTPIWTPQRYFDSLVEILTDSGTSVPLLPRLKSLTLSNLSMSTIDAMLLMTLVHSRRRSDNPQAQCTRIESIILYFGEGGIKNRAKVEEMRAIYKGLVIEHSRKRPRFYEELREEQWVILPPHRKR